MKNNLLLIFGLIFCISSGLSQEKTMRNYVSKYQTYEIYYPLDFQIYEDESGIVSIKDSISQIEITISTNLFNEEIDDVSLIYIMNEFLVKNFKAQHDANDWKSYKTKFDNLVEISTYYEDLYWIWIGLNQGKKVFFISLNKPSSITEDNIHLLRYMIESLIIH